MKIFYIAHRIPFPPNKGEKIRTFNQIKYLSDKHDIFLCFLVDDKRDLAFVESLRDYCSNMEFTYISSFFSKLRSLVQSFFSPLPITVLCFRSKRLEKRLNRIFKEQQFDIVIASCSSVAQYIPNHIKPKVMDLIDVDSDKWSQYAQFAQFPKKWIYKREAQRMKKYEQHLISTWEKCYVISPQEAQVVASQKKLEVLANGVDLEYFANTYQNHGVNIVFLGTMNYFPNEDAMLYFHKQIWPQIIERDQHAKLYIVGRDPSPAICELKSDRVIVTGAVEDTRPYLQNAKVAIAPIRIARGVQNKVLEYLACDLPCVISSSAAEGIDLKDLNDGLWIEDTPTQFAERVLYCLQNDVEISPQRRQKFAQKYSWQTHLHNWEQQLTSIVQGTSNER